MQNKRGISQAFAPAAQDAAPALTVRDATVFDVFAISTLLQASITSLCHADHGGDPAKLAPWLANKSPADIRAWITSGTCLRLAELNGAAAAAGAVIPGTGRLELLYAAPQAAGQGAGTALLADLEEQLRPRGTTEASLTATRTAHGFYRAHGWQDAGPPVTCFAVPGYPMRKALA
jgi:GNAT superfamily N-acetyltransferase